MLLLRRPVAQVRDEAVLSEIQFRLREETTKSDRSSVGPWAVRVEQPEVDDRSHLMINDLERKGTGTRLSLKGNLELERQRVAEAVNLIGLGGNDSSAEDAGGGVRAEVFALAAVPEVTILGQRCVRLTIED